MKVLSMYLNHTEDYISTDLLWRDFGHIWWERVERGIHKKSLSLFILLAAYVKYLIRFIKIIIDKLNVASTLIEVVVSFQVDTWIGIHVCWNINKNSFSSWLRCSLETLVSNRASIHIQILLNIFCSINRIHLSIWQNPF